jgi:hypothetical protein
MVQQVYLKGNQPDLCCLPSDRAPYSDEHFMPYVNTTIFRAWCENKIPGIRCQPPSNAPWTDKSLADYILHQLRTIKPRYFINDFDKIDLLVAPVNSAGDATEEYRLWLSLIGQFIKNITDRILKDYSTKDQDIDSLHSINYILTARLPIDACQQFYAATRYGIGNLQANQLFKTFEGLLLAHREPIVVALWGTFKTKQLMKTLETLVRLSPTRHIKVLLCGTVSPSVAPDFPDFQLIDSDTVYKGININESRSLSKN